MSENTNLKKFLIIDGNSIMNRAFYGLSPRVNMTADGIHTNALYGFLNIYWMIINKYNPDYTMVAFDVHAKTFRHEMYDEYKGTRKGMPDELRPQMVIIKDILKALNIPIIEKEGFEADDLLGTIAKINTNNNIFTYILSGDKDSFQLISETTNIILPTTKMGKTEYTTYTCELLKESLNIQPYQVVDIKSLMGDSSDNIPGVKGIGEKTAYSLIDKYTTLDSIYSNIDSLDTTPKIIEKLIADKENAYLSYTLAKINCDTPITIDYEIAKVGEPNLQDLYLLFKKYKFNKFMDKFDFASLDTNLIMDVDSNSNIQYEFNLPKYTIAYLDNVITLNDILNSNLDKDISYYLNITTNHISNNMIDILENSTNNFLSFTFNDPTADKDSHMNNYLYIIKLDDLINEYNLKDVNYTDTIDYKLLSIIISSNNNKIGFNIKQDLRFFMNIGLNNFNKFNFDTLIAKHLIYSNISKYTMPLILESDLNTSFKTSSLSTNQVSLFDEETTKYDYFSDNDIYNLSIYLHANILLKSEFTDILSKDNLLELFNIIEMPLCETLASMEVNGMYIDINKLNEFNLELTDTIFKLEQEIYILGNGEFNINSPKQLGEVLFDKLNLPANKKNKNGNYSTDKDVLESLEDIHPIISKVLEYRMLSKLQSTFVIGLRDKIEEDGRIHTTFMQTVTSTGRISSIEPNLQNIPVRLELGSKIRTFFTAENDNILLDSDYSQIELRVLSHISNDDTMIQAFLANDDIHSITASQVFDIPLDEVTKELRSKAKAVNFGIVYGISSFGLSKNIDSSVKEANKYIESYLSKYNKVKGFMNNSIKEAKEKGYVTTLYNRRRYIDELKSSNKVMNKFGERIAMNTPVQGSAADIIKIAMNNIYYKFKNLNLKSKLVMQVHDELIIECDKTEKNMVKKILKDEMENAVILKVPLVVDVNEGLSWYDAK